MRPISFLCLFAAALGGAVPLLAAPAPSASTARVELTVTVTGLRSHHGVVRIAVCASDSGFPQCRDRAVAGAVIAVAEGATSAQIMLPPGSYAISAFHDRNNNGRLDTAMGIPREGFAFSRNPPLRMRAATFEEARLEIDRPTRTTLHLRHLL